MRQAASPQLDFEPAIRVEHVCLETEPVAFDGCLRGNPVGPPLTIASRFRGCSTELTVLEGHRLAVRARRPDHAERQYVVDLRFVDSLPVTRRFVAWRCWSGSIALAALAAASEVFAAGPDGRTWLDIGWLGSIGLLAAGVGLGVLALYRTHETTQFQSVHGRAALVEITGNLGCSRAVAAFAADITRQISEVRADLAQSRQRFLCDELQEHRRLFQDGVLSQDAYEASKRRILQAHR